MTTAIIPVYNEEATVGAVLSQLLASPWVDEVVVVNDASTDGSLEVLAEYAVKVINLPVNRGKSYAMAEGLLDASGDLILMLDADLIGLHAGHIEDLIRPVLEGRADMSVGQFVSGAFWTTLSQHITPFLSGQRALRPYLLRDIPGLAELGYGLELTLTRYSQKNNIPMVTVPLRGLTHVVKEKKRGFIRGFSQRMKMYFQIFRALSAANLPVRLVGGKR